MVQLLTRVFFSFFSFFEFSSMPHFSLNWLETLKNKGLYPEWLVILVFIQIKVWSNKNVLYMGSTCQLEGLGDLGHPKCQNAEIFLGGAIWLVLRRTLWCLGNWAGGECCLASRRFRWVQWGRATASCMYLHFITLIILAVSEFWTSLGIVYWQNRQIFLKIFSEMDAFPHRLTRLWFLLIFILTCLQPPFNFQTCVIIKLPTPFNFLHCFWFMFT